jgi:hypothetical protein
MINEQVHSVAFAGTFTIMATAPSPADLFRHFPPSH